MTQIKIEYFNFNNVWHSKGYGNGIFDREGESLITVIIHMYRASNDCLLQNLMTNLKPDDFWS